MIKATKVQHTLRQGAPLLRFFFLLIHCYLLSGLVFSSGCSRWSRPRYETPPSTINRTADIDAKALQRGPNLQNLAKVQESSNYRIGPNDVVEIKVFDHDRMNVSSRVSGNGMINFPQLGEIHAAGLSERQLEKLIENRLRGTYVSDPQVMVFVKEVQARMLGIIGAVNLPGQYSSFGEMRLADLISKAGGLSPEAGDAAYILRYSPNRSNPTAKGQKGIDAASDTIKVDLDGLVLRGEREWNVVLEPGDMVNIPTAGMVFITGLGIKRPGTYPLVNRMTLQQLVDLAEGLKYEANHHLLLVRTNENGTKKVYNIDYDKLRAARTDDIQLRSADKVIVDRTAVKTVLASIGRGMSRIFGVTMSAEYQLSSNNDNNNND